MVSFVEPLVPVTVTVWLLRAALLPAVMVRVELPAPVMVVGLKLMEFALPSPVAERVMVPLNPPVIAEVIFTVPVAPRSTVMDVGDALMVKPAFTVVTVREMVVVSIVEPLVPVMVIVEVPAAALDETVKVRVELPAPVIDVGLNEAVTPVGRPLALSVTAESNPPATETVMVEVPVLPAATDNDAGEADSE